MTDADTGKIVTHSNAGTPLINAATSHLVARADEPPTGAAAGEPLIHNRVPPTWIFGLNADDFTGSPARWTFG